MPVVQTDRIQDELPTVIPDGTQRIQADPSAFGAAQAQATGQLGAGLGAMANAAQVQQNFLNRAKVTDALTQGQAGAIAAQYGDPNNPNTPGFYSLGGKQAVDAFGGAQQQVLDGYSQARAGLDNPAQQQMFDRESRLIMMRTLSTMAKHNSDQQRVYAQDTQTGAINLGVNSAIAGAANPDLFNTGLQQALNGQSHLDAMQGLPPEMAQANAAKVTSKAFAGAALRLNTDDPTAALAFLQAHSDKIDPELLPQVQGVIKKSAYSVEANTHADGLVSGAGATLPPGALTDKISAAAANQGISKGLALTVANIESGVGTVQNRPGSQYQGPFQMGDDAWAARGGTAANRGDQDAQVNLGVANVKHSQDVATQALGAPAADWQTYLVHQQGDAGGTALLRADPNASAAQVLAAAYGGSTNKATMALVCNGGRPDCTVQQFLQHWQQQYQAKEVGGDPTAADAPQQSRADYFRSNYATISDQARAQAMALHPDDPTFADLMVSRTQQRMGEAIQQQTLSYKADNDLVFQAANGDLSRGTAPTSVDALAQTNPQVAAAWARMQVQQPQVAHEIATRVLTANARPESGDAKTLGPAFYDVFNAINAPNGSPTKITDPAQLYSMLGHGLTMAGMDKARREIAGKNTPDGEAESAMRVQFFKSAKGEISGADDGLGIKDPKGEQQFLKFIAQAYPAIDAAKAACKTPAQIYNPDSPDYVGKIIPTFKRSMAQQTADMLAPNDVGGAGPAAPKSSGGWFGGLFGGKPEPPPDLTSPAGIKAAVVAGKLSRQEAIQRLTGAMPQKPGAQPMAAAETP